MIREAQLRDALSALRHSATAYMLSVTSDEKARTEPLVLEAIDWAREELAKSEES